MSRATLAGLTLGVLALTLAVRPVAAQQGAVRVPPAVLERYVGEYIHPAGGIFTIRRSGDTLFKEDGGQRQLYMPLTESLFQVGPQMTAEFLIDQAGGVTQLVTNGIGFEFRLRRKGSPPEPPAALPVAAVRVPRKVLERYVGTYEFIPGQGLPIHLRVVVRLEGDRLIRHMMTEEVLTPLSETRFRVGTTSLVTEFVIDDRGVTQVMGTGARQMLARRTSKR